MAVREFKKPSGFIFKVDSNVHSAEYIASCESNFEEVKKEVKKVKKESKKKGGK